MVLGDTVAGVGDTVAGVGDTVAGVSVLSGVTQWQGWTV
jgi:hypothetical protein